MNDKFEGLYYGKENFEKLEKYIKKIESKIRNNSTAPLSQTEKDK